MNNTLAHHLPANVLLNGKCRNVMKMTGMQLKSAEYGSMICTIFIWI